MSYRIKSILIVISLILSLFLVSGCSVSPDNFSDSGYEIQNDETQLQVRLTEKDQVIEV